MHEKIRQYKRDNPNASHRDIVKALGTSKGTVQRALKAPTTETDVIEITGTKIKTIEQAIKYANIDTNIFEVVKSITNHWDVTNAEGKTYTNYQIKLYLKRRNRTMIDVINHITKCLKNTGPKITPSICKDGCWAFIGLYDTHFGKLGWKEEVNENYDLKIAKTVYLNAIMDTLERIKTFGVSKIVYPIGQDFLHINNSDSTTVNNTPQDVDGRLFKVYSTAFECAIRGIEECLKVAPVEVIYLTGNHDRDTSWYLSHAIQQRFYNNKHITVDLKPVSRKYRNFGSCLIGLAHGNNVRARKRLHNLMTLEQRKNWSKATCCEWLTGHYHKRNEERITTIDTDIYQTVRVLPSLCGRDKWHFDNAFISPRACETYIYHPEDGYVGHISANPRS